jgi:hypothetical protein
VVRPLIESIVPPKNVIGLAGLTMERCPTVTASATCWAHTASLYGCGTP